MKPLLSLMLVVWMAACAMPREAVRYPGVRWMKDRDDVPIARPQKTGDYPHWEAFAASVLQPVLRNLDLSEVVVFEEAQDVNNFDEVADSSWFTNRIGRFGSPVVGNALKAWAPAAGPWEILSKGSHGHARELLVRDRQGTRFVLKFDALGSSELVTGAEVISNRILWAAGYHVPDTQVMRVEAARLRLADGAARWDRYGRRRSLTFEDLAIFWRDIPRAPDGSFRVAMIRMPEGEPVGPFSFKGRRKGDSNDRIRHQQRRVLRGLKVFSAVLNHRDIGEANTLDVFQQIPGSQEGFLRHYLVDFDETLGSGGAGPMAREHLYDYSLNYGRTLVTAAMMGGYTPFWERLGDVEVPEAGRFESRFFKAQTWKPTLPNAAFSQITARDGFWAARILMKFSDSDLRRLVQEAHYSKPSVASFVTQTLGERRDKAGRYWFERVNPLDDFEVREAGDAAGIHFHDLAVEHGFSSGKTTRYRYRVLDQRNGLPVAGWREAASPLLLFDPDILKSLQDGRFYMVRIETLREERRNPLPALDVLVTMESSRLRLLGLKRRY